MNLTPEALSPFSLVNLGSSGYLLQGTHHRPLWSMENWREVPEVVVGVCRSGMARLWFLMSIGWHCNLTFVFIFLCSQALLQEVKMWCLESRW